MMFDNNRTCSWETPSKWIEEKHPTITIDWTQSTSETHTSIVMARVAFWRLRVAYF